MSSHRGVRLHTFEAEDRAYTSTPTKIGGHCLDHVRNGLTLKLSYNISSPPTSFAINNSSASPSFDHNDSNGQPIVSSTLESRGRFGGLCGKVLKLTPAPLLAALSLTGQRHACRPFVPLQQDLPLLFLPELDGGASMMPLRTINTTPADFPRDVAAPPSNRNGTTHFETAAATELRFTPWQQQAYGPAWPADNSTAAGLLGSNRNSSSNNNSNRNRSASPLPGRSRQMATAATGHTGALMAVLLSKLANEDGSASSPQQKTASDGHPTAGVMNSEILVLPTTPQAADAELRRTVDSTARNFAANTDTVSYPAEDPPDGTTAAAHDGGAWAWKARLAQAPARSKLHRYTFVRELGRGSHGTVLLVKKKRFISDNGGGRRNENHSNGRSASSSRTQEECLRVLKESHFLPEAVNEARLLLQARTGEGRSSGGFTDGSLQSRRDRGETAAAVTTAAPIVSAIGSNKPRGSLLSASNGVREKSTISISITDSVNGRIGRSTSGPKRRSVQVGAVGGAWRGRRFGTVGKSESSRQRGGVVQVPNFLFSLEPFGTRCCCDVSAPCCSSKDKDLLKITQNSTRDSHTKQLEAWRLYYGKVLYEWCFKTYRYETHFGHS